MNRLILVPLAVAVALAAGPASAQARDTAQSYGYTEREGATYEEPIGGDTLARGDAYAAVYGDGRSDDYHDYGDYGPERGYGDGIVPDIANAGRPDEPLIVPDRYGRDGAFAMARVLRVDPLVARDGCTDTRHAGDVAPYRGQVVSRDGDYYGDGAPPDAYREDRYHEDGYARSGDDGYYDPRYGQGYGGGYGQPAPRTSGMGAAIGAIIGGVIGNEIADDDDHHGYYGYSGEQAAATMIGALLGGAVGAGIERQVAQNRERQYYEQQRQSQYRGQPAAAYGGGAAACGPAAYRVTYEYAGRQYEAVTDYDPGEELRVRIEV